MLKKDKEYFFVKNKMIYARRKCLCEKGMLKWVSKGIDLISEIACKNCGTKRYDTDFHKKWKLARK